MGSKWDEVKLKVQTLDGSTERFKAKGAMILVEQKDRAGLYLTGKIEPELLAEALMMALEQMPPGSDEEDMTLSFIMRVCVLAVRNNRVMEMMRFRAETAAMVREVLGAGMDEEDETDE